jgi:hypothetical protein
MRQLLYYGLFNNDIDSSESVAPPSGSNIIQNDKNRCVRKRLRSEVIF